jgi:hypothetical protein
LNFSTGRITIQYHVVFGDLFTAVPSIEREHKPPSHWEELCLEESIHIPVDNESAFLHDDWLTTEDQERKNRQEQRSDIIRDAQVPPYGVERQPETQTTASAERPNLSAADLPNYSSHTTAVPFVPHPTPPTSYNVPTHAPTIAPFSSPIIKSEGASAPVNTEGVRRSTRSSAGKRLGKRYDEEPFLACVCADDALPCESADGQLAYLVELHTDMNDGTLDIIDPRLYTSKKRKSHDPDTHMLHEAMRGPHAEEYKQAMKVEMSGLIRQKTWKAVERSSATNIIKSTWAFKCKRLPDRTVLKLKAHFCVRGDLQEEGVDYFETYAPVVAWSTVRMLLTMVLHEGWTTKQVNYTNAFVQAELDEALYVEPPKLFETRSGKDLVLKLLKSLYGLKQAPRTFFEKLREGLR